MKPTPPNRTLLTLWVPVAVALTLCLGCGESTPTDARNTTSETNAIDPPKPAAKLDHLAEARRLFRQQDYDAAAISAQHALVQNPDQTEAKLVAIEVEAARGNHQVAVDLAASVDPASRLGGKAVELQIQQLIALGKGSAAADVAVRTAEQMPQQAHWQHLAWALLHRVGRSEEASHQAERLCRAGQATEAELVSLVRRHAAFPIKIPQLTQARRHFDPGLGLARWYFSRGEFRKALDELTTQSPSVLSEPAAAALHGRLLAETQTQEQIPQWHAQCDVPKVERLGDYWAALGLYFLNQREFEASARTLLEAVKRNPTDSVCVQRLAQVFDALDRPQQAAEFRQRGIEMAQAQQASERIKTSARDEARRQLARHMLELGRPFETLAWTLQSMPASARAERADAHRQREQLLRSKDALAMASQMATLEMPIDQFDMQPAFRSLLLQGESNLPVAVQREVATIATPRLVDVASQSGLEFQWYPNHDLNVASIPIHESVGGGIAVIDYDLDGWPDLYLAQGSGEPPTSRCTRSNQLMRNLGGRFREVTAAADASDFNYGAGLAAGDVNQDGFADLYLGSLGHNRLLINNGDGTFRDATAAMGDVPDQFTSSLAIADINGDHLPDLFEAVYIEMEGAFVLPEKDEDGFEKQPSPLKHYAQSDRWFLNTGDGGYQVQSITRQTARPGTSLGVIVSDFDGDGNNEIFVGNDVRPNHYLVQAGNNQLLNAADAKGVANGFDGAANGCMGIAAGDFNRDGTLDLHITNFNQESANLYLQANGGGFTDMAVRYGLDKLSDPYVGFGTKAIDLDRNGWLDLLVTNGHIFDMRRFGEGFRLPPQCLMHRGTHFEQVDVEDPSGYWSQEYLGRAMSLLDFDRDGALDVVINHLDRPLALLHNQTPSDGTAVQLELRGTTSERDAIGARAVLHTSAQSQTQWVTAGDGYYSSDEPLLDFGLPPGVDVAGLEVYWPSGTQQTFRGLQTGKRYLIVEGHPDPLTR